MTKIYGSVLELVGNTPMVNLSRYAEEEKLAGTLLGKLERSNPGGSAKDRVALAMLDRAEAEGRIAAGATLIEPTSGNTGVGLAVVAAVRGYRLLLTMPDTMSVERRRLLAAYGAELVLTPGSEGMAGAVKRAEELQRQIPNSMIPSQFDNPANPYAHECTTGPEIWRDTDGNVDVFVAGVGTGGTLSGTAKYLKEHHPAIEIVAVEPAGSPLLSEGRTGKHDLQGIGANFVPKNLNRACIDRIVPVADADAYRAARLLAKREGLLVGITSGAAVHAAAELLRMPAYAGKTVVALLPDTGERYLSTKLFSEEEA